jgi:hypothetical protein
MVPVFAVVSLDGGGAPLYPSDLANGYPAALHRGLPTIEPRTAQEFPNADDPARVRIASDPYPPGSGSVTS